MLPGQCFMAATLQFKVCRGGKGGDGNGRNIFSFFFFFFLKHQSAMEKAYLNARQLCCSRYLSTH